MTSNALSVYDLLVLEQVDALRFRGRSCPVSQLPRVYGGQVIAQALMAAGRSVEPDRRPHSLHAYFLREGDPTVPIDYEVQRTRHGASFTTRRVTALQFGAAIGTVVASFQVEEALVSHQVPVAKAPPATALQPPNELMDALDPTTRAWWRAVGSQFPVDLRWPEVPLRARIARGERPPARQEILVRCSDGLGDDPLVHACALAYVSDLFLLSTALAPHGLMMGPGHTVTGASLDHAIWLHGPVRADDWLEFQMEAPWADGGRALCRGDLFAGAELVGTVVQEGLVRRRRDVTAGLGSCVPT